MARVSATVENTYEYAGHSYDSMDAISNLLNFNLKTTRDVTTYTMDVELIMKEAQSLAKRFVKTNHPVPYSPHQPTDKLYGSIRYDLQTSSGGTGARLFADAVDEYGHKYAGHIEYGFTDKLGIPHGPWPFLRPALRMATEASRGRLVQHMAGVALYGDGALKFEDIAHNGKLFFGGRKVEDQIRNAGGRASLVSEMRKGYGSTPGSKKWEGARNGIGYVSKVKSGYTVTDDQYKWGEL